MDTCPKTALITGATGYIGSELASYLIQKGWAVNVIVRQESNRSQLERQVEFSRFATHLYDGSTKSLVTALESSKPDVVFHLASSVLHENSFENFDLMLEANIQFGVHLAQAMLSAGVSRLVNTGTFWQSYNCKPYDPVNFYAATKQAYESLLQYYVNAHNFLVVNLKLCDVYGNFDPRPKLLNQLKNALKNGQVVPMSPGEQEIDLVHVRDVVAAYELAAKNLISGQITNMETFGVSSSQSLTLKALLKKIEKITGEKILVQIGALGYRQREVMKPCVEKPLQGWVAKVRLDEGLREFFSDVF